MADQAPTAVAQKNERTPAPERSARPDVGGPGGGMGLALPLGQAVDLDQLLPRLGAADLATRARAVLSLQRSHGNAAIATSLRTHPGRRPLLQRQWGMPHVPATGARTRAPAATTPAPIREEAAQAEEQPVAPPDAFDHGLLRAVEIAARIAHLPKEEQNDSSPAYQSLMAQVDNQWIDARTGRIRADIGNVLVESWLPSRARQMVETMLDDSETRAKDEGRRYQGAQGEGDADALRKAASQLADAKAEGDRRVDAIRKEEQHKQMYPRGEEAGIGAGYNVYEAAEVRKKAVAAEEEVRQDFERMRRAYGAQFPVLLAESIDFAAVAKADQAKLKTLVAGAVGETLENIAKTRKNLKGGLIDIWDLEPVIARVKEHYGVEPGSYADQIIDRQRAARGRKSFWEGIATAVLMIGLTVVGVIATGGVALVALGAGATISGAQAVFHAADYQVKKAAHGTDLDVAGAISAEDPSLFWLAFDIVGAVLDVGTAAKAFKELATVEENLSRLKVAAHEEGRRLADAGKLRIEGEATDAAKSRAVERFVDRIMRSARAVHGATGRRARILAELLRGSGARAVSLLAGEQKAMAALLKEWGNWNELMLALGHGTPDMRTMARNLIEFREGIVARLGRAPAQGGVGAVRVGRSTQLGGDLALKVGSEADLLKAEKFMADAYGSNWSRMFRLSFYPELAPGLRKIAARYGWSEERLAAAARILEERNAKVYFRRSSKWAPIRLKEGAIAKPVPIKANTLDELDLILGSDRFTRKDLGLVGHYEPLPASSWKRPAGMSRGEWERIQPRLAEKYEKRLKSFRKLEPEMKELARPSTVKGSQYYEVEAGKVYQIEVTDGGGTVRRALTGDVDVFEFRAAGGGELSEREYEMLDDLFLEAGVSEHGAHVAWRTRGDFNEDAFYGIIEGHLKDPVIEVGPGGAVRELTVDQVPGVSEILASPEYKAWKAKKASR